MKFLLQLVLVCMLVAPLSAFSQETGLTVTGIRYFSYDSFTRIVFEVQAAAPYVVTKTPDGHGVLLSAYEGQLTIKSPLPVIHDSLVSGMETKLEAGRIFVLIRLDPAAGGVKDFVLRGPDRIVLDVAKAEAAAAPVDKPVVVVLDAGHGGRDSGIIDAQGQEKSMTLDLAFAVKRILQKDQHLKVVLTRERDLALTLDERAAAANSAGAQIFVSLHGADGNSERVYFQDPDESFRTQSQRPATGDFLSFEAGSEHRENQWGRQQAAHAGESAALAREIARQFAGKDQAEPVQAPLAGFRAVDAAAVMVEIGAQADRTLAAEAMAKGIEQHVRENR